MISVVRTAAWPPAAWLALPGTLLYVYYGKLAGDVAALAGGASVENGAGYYTVLGFGLIATVVVTTIVTRTAQRALRETAEVDVETADSKTAISR